MPRAQFNLLTTFTGRTTLSIGIDKEMTINNKLKEFVFIDHNFYFDIRS